MNRHFITFLIFAYACLGTLQAQQDWTIDKQLAWAERPQEVWQNDQRYEIWTFANSSRSDAYGLLPMVNERIALPSNGIAQVSIINMQFSKLDRKSDDDDAMLSSEIKPEYWIEQERNNFFLRVRFVPIRTAGATFPERHITTPMIPTAAMSVRISIRLDEGLRTSGASKSPQQESRLRFSRVSIFDKSAGGRQFRAANLQLF